MSSTGTRKPRDVQSRASEAIIENDKELIQSFKIFAESSNSTAGLAGPAVNNSPKTPAGNYVAREGDSMIGPLALGPPVDFRIEVDADNTIDIGSLNDNAQFSSNVQLDDLQPNSSVLDIIANAAFDGQILIIRTFAPTVPYTISQGTLANGGNIQTPDGNDIELGDLQISVLVFDESLIIHANTGGTWRVLFSGGGGGVGDPIILNDHNYGQVGNETLNVDWTLANLQRMEVSDDNLVITMINLPEPSPGRWERIILEFTQDLTGHTVSFTDTFLNGVVPVVDSNPESVTSIEFYSYGIDATTHALVAFVTSGAFQGVADPVFMVAKMSSDQIDPVVNDVVDFDSVTEGSGLILTNGVISGFVPGHIYECSVSLGISGNTGRISYQFFENTGTPQLIGTRGIGIAIDSGSAQSNQSTASAIFSPTDVTDTLEVRVINTNIASNDILSGSSGTDVPMSLLKIIDITGYVGGSGTTIAFPKILINDVMTVANVTGTLNIDLAISQHWVLELIGNVTLTFINVPVANDTSEQVILEYVQDILGGHIVTYADTIAPVDPPVVTTAGSREVITGFSRRTNGGTILFNLYLVGN